MPKPGLAGADPGSTLDRVAPPPLAGLPLSVPMLLVFHRDRRPALMPVQQACWLWSALRRGVADPGAERPPIRVICKP